MGAGGHLHSGRRQTDNICSTYPRIGVMGLRSSWAAIAMNASRACTACVSSATRHACCRHGTVLARTTSAHALLNSLDRSVSSFIIMFGLDEEPGPAAFLVNASRIDQPAANDF